MKRISLTVATLAAGALMLATGAEAQARLGLAAGLAVPTGNLADFTKSGFNVEGSVEFRPASMPFGLRADVFFNQFALDEDVTDVGGNVRMIGGALNAVFQMAGVAASPYLVVGPSITNADANVDAGEDPEGETKFGLQGGIGVKFPLSGFTSKIEARYNTIFTDEDNTNYFIINFGIMGGGR